MWPLVFQGQIWRREMRWWGNERTQKGLHASSMFLWFHVHSPFLQEEADTHRVYRRKHTEQNVATLYTLIITYGFLSVSSEFQLPDVCTVITDAQQVIETSAVVWNEQKCWSIFSIVIWREIAAFCQKRLLHLIFNIGCE